MRNLYFRALIISLLFFNSLSFAQIERTAQGRAVVIVQNEPSQPSPEQLKAQAELEKKSFALLEEVLAESAILKLPENKLYANFTLADLLWKKDENRAREIFKIAAQIYVDYTKSLNPEAENYNQIFQGIQQIRHFEVTRLSRRDPQVALDFLRATRIPSPDGNELQFEAGLEGRLASQITRSNPKMGFKLAMESLEKGLTSAINESLFALQANNPKDATELAQAVLQKIRNEDLLKGGESFYVAFNLFNVVSQNTTRRQPIPNSASASLLTQSEIKELATIIVSQVLKSYGERSNNSNSHFASNIFSNLESFEKLIPAKVAELKVKANYVSPSLSQTRNSYEELNQLSQKSSVGEILAASKKVNIEMRDSYIDQAASKAFQSGDMNLTQQILADNFSNPAERKNRMDNYLQSRLMQLQSSQNFEEAHQAIQLIKNNDRKFNALISLVNSYPEKDKKRALQILDEAYSLIQKETETYNYFRQSLTVIAKYLVFDFQQGTTIISPLSHQLNEVVSAGIIFEKFEGRNTSRAGEVLFRNGSLTTSLVNEYCAILGTLAKSDFEQAKSFAEQFQRTDLRLLAKLSMLQSLLASNSQYESH